VTEDARPLSQLLLHNEVAVRAVFEGLVDKSVQEQLAKEHQLKAQEERFVRLIKNRFNTSAHAKMAADEALASIASCEESISFDDSSRKEFLVQHHLSNLTEEIEAAKLKRQEEMEEGELLSDNED
jgi:hypothetical protein